MVLLQKMATRRQHFSMLQRLFLLFCNFLVILHRNIVDFWCFCFRCTRTRFNYTQMFICYLSGPFSHLGDSVQFSCSVVPDSLRPGEIAARQASLSITNSRSSLKLNVHQVGDAIQPSYPTSSPSPPAPNPSQHQSFPMSQLFAWLQCVR